MRVVLAVAGDVFREAASRRWFLALAILISLALLGTALTLRLEVVDGALAATRFFGKNLSTDIRSVDVALRPVFQAVSYVVFYGGISFFILACSDFGPSLLAPGRIEHALSLPVERWQLLAGTFLGVLGLATLGAVYGAGGLVVLLGVKTGVWTARPVIAALIASVTFSALYGAMLAAAVFVRSAALSAATGGALFVAGIVAGYRHAIVEAFDPGLSRRVFEAVTFVLPRVSALADAAGEIAGSGHVDRGALAGQLAGLAVFGVSALLFGVARFEQKDY